MEHPHKELATKRRVAAYRFPLKPLRYYLKYHPKFYMKILQDDSTAASTDTTFISSEEFGQGTAVLFELLHAVIKGRNTVSGGEVHKRGQRRRAQFGSTADRHSSFPE